MDRPVCAAPLSPVMHEIALIEQQRIYQEQWDAAVALEMLLDTLGSDYADD